MADPQQTTDIVIGLSDKGLCKDPNLGLNEEQIQICIQFVEDFMPPALKALFIDYAPEPKQMCSEYFDLCNNQEKTWWKK